MPRLACAQAMPAPIMPAPRMPTRRGVKRGTSRGRLCAALTALRSKKKVLIMLRATGVTITRAR